MMILPQPRRLAALLVPALMLLSSVATRADSILISDFDDGTRTGWTTIPVFHGNLLAESTGGNPGGFMYATDNTQGGFLFARYYVETFDLTNMAGISWDEFVYDNGTDTHQGTSALLLGTDGTIFLSNRPLTAVETWVPRFASFDPAVWWEPSGSAGTSSFADVLRNAQIGLSLDTSTTANGIREAGVDNVRLFFSVPEPSSGALCLGMSLTWLTALACRSSRTRRGRPGPG